MSAEAANLTVLTVLAAGDSVYVFPVGDDRIDVQDMTLVGANLDVERFTITAARWPEVVPKLLEQGVEVVDCRRMEAAG